MSDTLSCTSGRASSWSLMVVVIVSGWSSWLVCVTVVGVVVVDCRDRGFRGPCALDRRPVPDRPIPSLPVDCPVVFVVMCVVVCCESLPEGLS